MARRKGKETKAPTRKEMRISRREREQVRLVYIGLGIVAALILIVLGFGLVQSYIIEPNATLAVVDGEEIIVRDYGDRVRYERFLLDLQFQQLQQQQAALGQSEDEQLSQLLASQYQQMATQLLQQRSVVDRQTLDTMIDERVIEAEAKRRGITVSQEEIDEAINRILAGGLGGQTAAAVSETATARIEATATATVWTPTPTFTPSPTLTVTESITPTATPFDTPTPAPTRTPNIIDEASLASEYEEWLNVLAENAQIDEATYREIIRKQVLRDKLQDAFGEEVPLVAEQARARHILVETEEEAQEVIERLNAGEAFADLAAELSNDTGSGARGGDLGFVPRGRFVAPVDEAIFSLPLGEISEPVESDFGWHVIEVLEREERELSPGDYRQSQATAFANWLDEARSNADIQDFWTIDSAPPDEFVGS